MSKQRQTIGGGFVVHRRGDSSNRLITHTRHPYEHGSLEGAMREAARLAAKYKREFAVFQQVGSVPAPVAAVEAVSVEEAA